MKKRQRKKNLKKIQKIFIKKQPALNLAELLGFAFGTVIHEKRGGVYEHTFTLKVPC